MASLSDPVPPGHGEHEGRSIISSAEHRRDPDRSYAVHVVYPDGNPQVESCWATLQGALDAAEREREWHLQHGHRKSTFFVGVMDEDNPERGWLGEEDMP